MPIIELTPPIETDDPLTAPVPATEDIKAGQPGIIELTPATQTPPGSPDSHVLPQDQNQAVSDQGAGERQAQGDFSIIPVTAPESNPGLLERATDAFDDALMGGTEAALALTTGVLAEPLAGARVIFDTLIESIGGDLDIFGKGAKSPESREAGVRIMKNLSETRDTLTFKPRTEAGQGALTAAGKTIDFLMTPFVAAGEFAGNEALELTGSPAIAAIVQAIPELAPDLLGFKGSKVLSKRRNIKAEKDIALDLSEASPSAPELRDASSAIYKELADSGVVFQKGPVRKAAREMLKMAREMGIRGKKDAKLAPKSFDGIVRFAEDAARGNISIGEMDTLRKILKRGTQVIDDGLENSISAQALDILDELVDSTDSGSLRFVDADGVETAISGIETVGGLPPKGLPKKAIEVPGLDLGGRYRVARDLWGRAKRSEMLQEAFEKAYLGASGFENGIVNQFRQILNSPRKKRFFNDVEKQAMRDVVSGKGSNRNLYKFLGRAGGFEGMSTNFLGTVGGSAIGAAMFGPAGAAVVPMIGVFSKQMAKRITEKGAKFADDIIRSGRNGRDIVAAYRRNTPKQTQNAPELSQLLMDPKVDISDLIGDNMAIEAAKIASQNRRAIATALETQAVTQSNEERGE